MSNGGTVLDALRAPISRPGDQTIAIVEEHFVDKAELQFVERDPLPPNAPASMGYFDAVTESPSLRAMVEKAKREFAEGRRAG